MPNKSPEPTAVGAVSSAVAVARRESAVAQLFSLGISERDNMGSWNTKDPTGQPVLSQLLFCFTAILLAGSVFILSIGPQLFLAARMGSANTNCAKTIRAFNGHIFSVARSSTLSANAYEAYLIGFAAAILNMRWKIIHNPHDDIPKKLY